MKTNLRELMNWNKGTQDRLNSISLIKNFTGLTMRRAPDIRQICIVGFEQEHDEVRQWK